MKFFNRETREVKNEEEVLAMINESLNDISGPVIIAGYKYDAADVLRLVDPVAYRCMVNDALDADGWEDYPRWAESVHQQAIISMGNFYNWNEEFGGKMLTPDEVYELVDMEPEEAALRHGWSTETAESAVRWSRNLVTRTEMAQKTIDSLLEQILITVQKEEILLLIKEISAVEKDFGDDPIAKNLLFAMRD